MNEALVYIQENRIWLDRLWMIVGKITNPNSVEKKIANDFLKVLGGSRELYLIWNSSLDDQDLLTKAGPVAIKKLMFSKKYSGLSLTEKNNLKKIIKTVLNEDIVTEEEKEDAIDFLDSNNLINFKTSNLTKEQYMRINSLQKETLSQAFEKEHFSRNGKYSEHGKDGVAWIWKSLNGLSSASEIKIKEYQEKYGWIKDFKFDERNLIDSLNPQNETLILDLENSTKKLKDHFYDPKMFEPIDIGDDLNSFFSNKGGIMPATITMIVGDPGIGKNTVWMEVLANIQVNNPDKKVLFVSAEMDEIDLKEYIERFPQISEIDMFFIGQFIDNKPKERLEALLESGYDLVLIDSFSEVKELVQSEYSMTSKNAEFWLLNQMLDVKGGKNNRKTYTSFLVIQQVNKGGNFLGSNKLKHNTTAFLEMRWDDEERYMEFKKNRRGFVNQRLYYSFVPEGVKYDTARLNNEKKSLSLLKQNTMDFETKTKHFDELFLKNQEVEELVEQDEDEEFED